MVSRMIALSPRQVLENICQNVNIFIGAVISFSTHNGNAFNGELLAIHRDKEGMSAVIKPLRGQDHQWVLLTNIDSITIHNPTKHQLAIMSGEPFDPLAGQPEPGKLSLARSLQEHETRVGKVLNKPTKIEFADNLLSKDGPERTLQIAVILATMDMLTSVLETKFQDQFERQEIANALNMIEFLPSDVAGISIKERTLQIHCPWRTPDARWNERSLIQSLNDCF